MVTPLRGTKESNSRIKSFRLCMDTSCACFSRLTTELIATTTKLFIRASNIGATHLSIQLNSSDRGFAVGVDNGKVPRLGIIPKYAEDEGEMLWVEAPGLNMLHCVNAWDDEDNNNNIVMVCTNARKAEHMIGQTQLSELTLEKVTIDVKAKRVERRQLAVAGKFHEFGTFNPAYANKKIRYVYAGVISSRSRSIVGVEKFDLSINGGDCMVASRMYGPGCHTGESFFVAKDPNNPMAEEDDGYLVTYVHDDNTEESRFLVMDAKSPELDIVAAVKLPQRVPNGFHSLFVSEDELNKLLSH